MLLVLILDLCFIFFSKYPKNYEYFFFNPGFIPRKNLCLTLVAVPIFFEKEILLTSSAGSVLWKNLRNPGNHALAFYQADPDIPKSFFLEQKSQ